MLFSPTATGYKNLINEGFNPENKKPFTIDNPGIYHCGDVMYDNSLYFSSKANSQQPIANSQYILCTIHRNNNTDEPERLSAIVKALLRLSKEEGTNRLRKFHCITDCNSGKCRIFRV
jgi:UDP-GlcNAc3NAcA epimerase